MTFAPLIRYALLMEAQLVEHILVPPIIEKGGKLPLKESCQIKCGQSQLVMHAAFRSPQPLGKLLLSNVIGQPVPLTEPVTSCPLLPFWGAFFGARCC
jgi:hypothetical protein